MSERSYEVGYCRPPKAHQFVKGQSGNRVGKVKKPPSTLAKSIEGIWMQTITIPIGGDQQMLTVFELISLQLNRKWSTGIKKAFKIYLKYRAYAATKPAIKFEEPGDADLYELLLRGDDGDEEALKQLAKRRKRTKKPKEEPLSEEQKIQREREKRLQRMRAGLEEPTIEQWMSARDASEMYDLFLQMPNKPPTPSRRKRRRKQKMEAGEIFEQVAYDPVTIADGGKQITVPRVVASIRILAANAAKGDLNCADLLIDIHTHSEKHGDFVAGVRIIPR